MAEDNEWNLPKRTESSPVCPELQDRFRRLLTELMFCLAGVPVFGLASAWIRPPLDISPSGALLPPRPEWEVLFYRWTPLILFVIAFACLVWLVIVLLRMAELRKERVAPDAQGVAEITRNR
jgi:hypothetical protein